MTNNMTWQIKDFNELSVNELYKILELRIDIFVVEQNCPYREIDGKDLPAKHLFLKENDRIVAYMRILPRGISFPEISFGRVVVAREYRRNGIAGALLEQGIKFIKEEWNETSVRIEAQLYARKLYEAAGFRQTSEEFILDGIPHIQMLRE